jgi:hypothetical protein
VKATLIVSTFPSQGDRWRQAMVRGRALIQG